MIILCFKEYWLWEIWSDIIEMRKEFFRKEEKRLWRRGILLGDKILDIGMRDLMKEVKKIDYDEVDIYYWVIVEYLLKMKSFCYKD